MASDESGPSARKHPRKKRRNLPPTTRQAARTGPGGPSTDPATNLLLADVALRGAMVIARMAIERALVLRNRYDATTATTIIAKRGFGKKLLSAGMSRVAAKSLPGALLVGGGMLGKILYDRAKAHRQARAVARKREKPANPRTPPPIKGNR